MKLTKTTLFSSFLLLTEAESIARNDENEEAVNLSTEQGLKLQNEPYGVKKTFFLTNKIRQNSFATHVDTAANFQKKLTGFDSPMLFLVKSSDPEVMKILAQHKKEREGQEKIYEGFVFNDREIPFKEIKEREPGALLCIRPFQGEGMISVLG
ncbi:MAG: hypothetical protein JSS34_02260 [Proteobacteria bacterium]|nr:hypothetical protein [Pseudomonadota bacterium]